MVDLAAGGCQHLIMDRVLAVPAFKDNYIWLLSGTQDTGGGRPVNNQM